MRRWYHGMENIIEKARRNDFVPDFVKKGGLKMSVFILKKYDKELIKFEMHKNFYDEMIVEILWKSKDVFDYG